MKKGLSKVGVALRNYNRHQDFFINLIEQYRIVELECLKYTKKGKSGVNGLSFLEEKVV